MNGTTLEVTFAMVRIPPMITIPTMKARTAPKIQPAPANGPASPPVTEYTWLKDWFAWNMLPPPSAPKIQQKAKRTAKTRPRAPMPISAKPFER